MSKQPYSETPDWDALEPHLLPAPPTAAEQAAAEARLRAPSARRLAMRARVAVGTAAIAVAVTIPDLSLGAMGSPYMRVDLGQTVMDLPSSVWSPSAGSTGPVYAPVIAAEEIAPASLTFSDRAGADNANTVFDRTMPLEFLEGGSERFDLAFAGIEMPRIDTAKLGPVRRVRGMVLPSQINIEPAPLAGLVQIEQINATRGFRSSPASAVQLARSELAPARSGLSSNRAVAAANESLEAAFAGVIDASGAARRSIPTVSDSVRPARAVPISAPDPAVSASAAAQAELLPKTRLDARVNGVLTGSVDFRQLDGTIAIRLGSVVDMLSERFSSRELDLLRSGQSINAFVTLAQLQAAGIPISYNPAYDEVEFGIDYQDAPQAAKVQVEQIGAPTAVSESVMIDQIPR